MTETAWGHKVALVDPLSKPRARQDAFWRPLREALDEHWKDCRLLDPDRPAPVLLLYRNSVEQVRWIQERYPKARLVCASFRVAGQAGVDEVPYFRLPAQAPLLRHHLATLMEAEHLRHRLQQWEDAPTLSSGLFLPSLNKDAANWRLTQEALRRSGQALNPAAAMLGISRQALSQYLARHDPQRVQKKIAQRRKKRSSK